MNEFISTLFIATIPAVLTAIISGLFAYFKTKKESKIKFKQLKEETKNEIQKIQKSHEFLLEQMKEQHKQDIEMNDKKHLQNIELMQKKVSSEIDKIKAEYQSNQSMEIMKLLMSELSSDNNENSLLKMISQVFQDPSIKEQLMKKMKEGLTKSMN